MYEKRKLILSLKKYKYFGAQRVNSGSRETLSIFTAHIALWNALITVVKIRFFFVHFFHGTVQ